jgi:protein TonB
MEPDEQKEQRARRLTIIGGAVAAVLLVAAIAWVATRFGGQDAKPERKVQTVQVVRPPPPPPEEKPPPPPPPDKIDEPLPQDEPEPAPADEPAPAQQLGLDADGTAGSDGFGLAARKGGRDITGSGGAVFAWYTTRLRDKVVERLTDADQLRARKYSIAVRVWIESDGRIREVRLASSTGDAGLDSAIESALESLPRMAEPPPVEMPQPISLRIVSRS